MERSVYLVEDNLELGELLTSYLSREGWKVRYFDRGMPAAEAIAERPSIWVLDIMLPDVDGFYLITKGARDSGEKAARAGLRAGLGRNGQGVFV